MLGDPCVPQKKDHEKAMYTSTSDTRDIKDGPVFFSDNGATPILVVHPYARLIKRADERMAPAKKCS